MKILWFTWKDGSHPAAGGAEFVNEQLAKRLAKGGHEVIFLVAGFEGGEAEVERDGYRIVRLGNRWTVYLKAWRYFRKHLKNWPDLVIDEVNTMPFFAGLYTGKPTVLVIYQLCREIWFYQLPLPFGLFGYLLEPLYLRLIKQFPVVTISESTRNDLVHYGFDERGVEIISVGIGMAPIDENQLITNKDDKPTLLSIGSLRPMKRTLDIVKAFEIAKSKLPELQLVVAGDSNSHYGQKVLSHIANSPYQKDIQYVGKVSTEQKQQLLQEAHLLAVTSVKEGWGLVVTEAASQGTPSVVYPVDGLRDSVENGQTGFLANDTTPAALGQAIVQALTNTDTYRRIQTTAWEMSKITTFGQAIKQLRTILNNPIETHHHPTEGQP